MSLNLRTSTRLAIQAAVAVSLAVIVSAILRLDHSYWAILTVMFLISQTWGENIKKSLQRIGMTIAGGTFGTIIFLLIGKHMVILFLCTLIAVFFTVYFFTISYLLMVFFVTVFVVFLFGTMSTWTVHLLEYRIIETFIGAVIAVATSAVVLPMTAKNNLVKSYELFLEKSIYIMKLSFEIAFGEKEKKVIVRNRNSLTKAYDILSTNANFHSYELFYTFYPHKKANIIYMKLGLLLHYLTSLLEAAPLTGPKVIIPTIKTELEQAQAILENNLKLLQKFLLKPNITCEFKEIDPLANKIIDKLTHLATGQKIKENYLLDCLSFVYFIQKINMVCDEIREKI